MFVLVLSLIIVFGDMVSGSDNCTRGHYWKEYKGEVPIDAFSAGTDKEGQPVYVGQMYLKDYGLLPTTIVPGAEFAFAATGSKIVQTNKDIKILCSINGGLQWLSPKAAREGSCSYVNGGSTWRRIETLKIGRANDAGATKVGQVYEELYIVLDNGTQDHLSSYEILSYNCIN